MNKYYYIFSPLVEVNATSQEAANKEMELFLRRLSHDVKIGCDNSMLSKVPRLPEHIKSWTMLHQSVRRTTKNKL